MNAIASRTGVVMAKSRQAGGGKQVNFRSSSELQARLDRTAEALGLDVSSLIRLVLVENLHQYEARAEQVLSRMPASTTKR
jgi:hypothetical protein